MAKAMGVKYITASSTVPMGETLCPYCEKNGIEVAFHGHSRMTDGEFASPESFDKAMAGRSKWIKINLDIGHFTASNYDAVDFIKKHHAKITNLHIKDRKKNHGPGVFPWGTGDTPMKEVLQLLKKEKYPIPANIELEGMPQGSNVIDVAKQSLAYMKNCLA